jgi:hypothetical protein
MNYTRPLLLWLISAAMSENLLLQVFYFWITRYVQYIVSNVIMNIFVNVEEGLYTMTYT